MRKSCRLWLIVLFILALTTLSLPVFAQDNGVTDDEVNEVAKDIYCPVCESTPLDVCGTQACADWRELIRTKLNEGQSRQEIFEYFARQYGDGVLADPPQRGISLIILWILPVVLLLVGLLFFSRMLARLRKTPETAAAAVASVSRPVDTQVVETAAPPKNSAQDDYLARVEEELGKKK
ncbi:MAG: cytochrome c-type biogenesis protein CcmH [Candidatus Promineifilaceae bacterium]|nr:cytochrome c-type biogenesis protein CcmH [Candidatus Promineifilaceae bacterium]